jgi:hypothetical protein
MTISVDEKPGVQALAPTAPELPPVPGQHATIGRDHEYQRLGTCSILCELAELNKERNLRRDREGNKPRGGDCVWFAPRWDSCLSC